MAEEKKLTKAQQYELDAKALIEIIGKDNIVSATHCQTRLRLIVNDHESIDNKKVEVLKSVSGTFFANGQYQVVIGTGVPDFFRYFSNEGNIKIATKDEQKELVKIQGNSFQRAMAIFSEIFIAIIPVIVAGGIILAFRNILELDWDPDINSEWSFVGQSQFLNSVNGILWLPANAIFWYLPVHVVWSVFNRKGKAQVLGIVIGIMLVSPGILVNLYDISGAMGQIYLSGDIMTQDGVGLILGTGIHSMGDISNALVAGGYAKSAISSFTELNNTLTGMGITGSYQIANIFNAIKATGAYYFFGWPLAISYIGQVIPALLVGAFSVWFFGFVDRHTWNPIRYVWPPFITIIVTLFVAHGILGPIGAILSFIVDSVFNWGFTSSWAKWFIGPLFGFAYPLIVVTGIHHTLNAVMLDLTGFTSMHAYGANYIFPILAISNMAQGAAVFGIFWMLRFDDQSKEATTAAGVTCWLGVTEPAMFGYNLKYMFPFVAGMIASALGGLLVVAFNITAYGIGMGGLLGFLNINNIFDGVSIAIAWPVYILVMTLTTVTAFVLTIVLSKFEGIFEKISSGKFSDEVARLRAEQS